MQSLEDRIKQYGHSLGFELVGIAPATEADGFDKLGEWLSRGFAGKMDYMHRHAEARRHPSSILADVRSVVMVAMNYNPGPLPDSTECHGRVARYALGEDYHDILRDKLKQLLGRIQMDASEIRGRAVVDTAPLLERDFARRAGLGWIGKNTMLLNKQLGSYFFLGALLLNLDLQPDPLHEMSHCGTCTACLDACPTDAFVEPGVLDSRRCISYLTIELRGPIPTNLRSPIGDWLFGCDVCQEVCPWNRKAPLGQEAAFQQCADIDVFNPIEILKLSEEQFRQRFRGTAFTRAKRSGLLRNAAIILGNLGNPAALSALREALTEPDPVIREAVQWAIERITWAVP